MKSNNVNNILPISLIIATADRSDVLLRTLRSVAEQSSQPEEIFVIDASVDKSTYEAIQSTVNVIKSKIIYEKAIEKGAAKQRNQGLQKAKCAILGFMDDDIILEQFCFENLVQVLNSDPKIGGVNAAITNQYFIKPGRLGNLFFRFMSGFKVHSFGGKVIGPAINFLPERDLNGKAIKVDWLNTTLTLYRRQALPEPVFDSHFSGYSFMEDVTLSLRVGKNWHLYNVPSARIFHDSQNSNEKRNKRVMAKMEIVNRYYIMTSVLDRKSLSAHVKFLIYQLFSMVATGNTFDREFWKGKIDGIKTIWSLKYK